MTVKFTTVPSKRLAETINGSAYSFSLQDIKGWNGSNLTSADFGTDLYASFRNSLGTKMELMKIDPATIASSSITILKRGLGFDGDQTTEVTANIQDVWVKGDTIVELGSHVSQLLEETVRKSGAQTIAGVKTFTSTPISTGGNATAGTELLTYGQALSMLTGTTNVNRVIVAGTAGETIAVDQLLYLKASDGRWWLADADVAATSENVILGIAQGSGTAGNTITSGVLIQGLNTFSALTLTANTKYYVSNTAGGFSSTPGTNEITLGESQSTTTFLFYPRNDQQLTEDQQDALAGTSGTPSGTNKYVTNDDTATTSTASKLIRMNANGQNPIPTINYQAFTASGTWTKPSNLTGNELVVVQLWGAGGGGGGIDAGASGGGGGGGGGAYTQAYYRASDLGATVTVTLGAGGAGGVGGINGTAGGNSTFGSLLSAYGGGGGGCYGGTSGAGGGGGGNISSGGSAVTATFGAGGNIGGGSTAGSSSTFGGGGGGPGGGSPHTGGSSVYGGGGGAGAAYDGGVSYNGGGGGAGGSNFGAAGSGGASVVYGGTGGAGGLNANGGAGIAPSGGGGGAGNDAGASKTGGAGARGECRVWVTYLAN